MINPTRGPWIVATSNSWRRIVSSDGKPVCEPVTQPDGHPDLSFPNGGPEGPDARLISAAPELYGALHRMLEEYIGQGPWHEGSAISVALRAIAKAEGKP